MAEERPASVLAAMAKAQAALELRDKVTDLVDSRVDKRVKEASAIMSVGRRKERLSSFAEAEPEHPDPIKAIAELNKMEHVYGEAEKSGDTYNQVILQGFTVEELRLLVQSRLNLPKSVESLET